MKESFKDFFRLFAVLGIVFILGLGQGRIIEREYVSDNQNIFVHYEMYSLGFRSPSDLDYCKNFVNLEQKMYCLGFEHG